MTWFEIQFWNSCRTSSAISCRWSTENNIARSHDAVKVGATNVTRRTDTGRKFQWRLKGISQSCCHKMWFCHAPYVLDSRFPILSKDITVNNHRSTIPLDYWHKWIGIRKLCYFMNTNELYRTNSDHWLLKRYINIRIEFMGA